MSEVGASVALAILLAWTVFSLVGLVLSPVVAVGCAVVLGALAATALRDTVPVAGLVAVLAPFGVMLPALAARHMAVKFGAPVPGFSTLELAVFFVGYLAFLSAAFGVVPLDLYRHGYAPMPVAVMVLIICAYAFVTGNWFLAGVAVAGQLAWVMGWGSSNWFDMMLHVLLLPIAVVTLILRLI